MISCVSCCALWIDRRVYYNVYEHFPHNKMVETKNSHTQQIKQLPTPIEALNGLLTTVLERI